MNRVRKSRIVIVLIVLMVLSIVPPEKAYAATIKISNSSAIVPVGMYKKLSVSGTTKTASWGTSNASVATVSSSGIVTGKKAGTALITAKVSGKSLKCKVTVINRNNAKQVGDAAVTIVRKYYKYAHLVEYERTGNTVKLTIARPQGDGAPGRTVTVNNSTGKAVWGAYWKDFFGKMPKTFTVWNCKAIKKVTKVSLNRTSASVVKGKTFTLKASIAPSNATSKGLTWSTSNKKVATVTSKGVVKAVGYGTATITAKAKDGSGKKAVCKVTVKSATVTVPNVTDKVLKMKVADAAKYLGLTQKKNDPYSDYTFFYIRRGKSINSSTIIEYYKGWEKRNGMWNLLVVDSTVSFYGVKVGMTEANAKKALSNVCSIS